jgi:gas vesicle protein
MNNSRTIAATLVGAIIGGAAGYLFFTDQGRTLRRQIEPALDDFARELISFRTSVQKAAGVANDGWRLLNEALAEGRPPTPRYAGPHQTSPF